jgi:hypothetical protein
MKRGGRPLMDAQQRRSLTLPPVKVNAKERTVIAAKAKAANLSLSAWQRYAAQERDPPRPRIIPALNQEAWLQLGVELRELRRLKLYFRAVGAVSVVAKLERIEHELKAVRDQLIKVVT